MWGMYKKKNEEYPPSKRSEHFEMSDLLDAVSTSRHESFSDAVRKAYNGS